MTIASPYLDVSGFTMEPVAGGDRVGLGYASPDLIVAACCKAFGVSLADVRGERRLHELRITRAAAEAIGRELGFSCTEMRRALGNGAWRGGWTKRPWGNEPRFVAGVRAAKALLEGTSEIPDTRLRGKPGFQASASCREGAIEGMCSAQGDAISHDPALPVESGRSGSEGSDDSTQTGEGCGASARSVPNPGSDRANAEGASQGRYVVRRPRDLTSHSRGLSSKFEPEAE